MARQCKLRTAEFRALVECPLSQAGYEKTADQEARNLTGGRRQPRGVQLTTRIARPRKGNRRNCPEVTGRSCARGPIQTSSSASDRRPCAPHHLECLHGDPVWDQPPKSGPQPAPARSSTMRAVAFIIASTWRSTGLFAAVKSRHTAAHKERASFECLEGEIHAGAHATRRFDDDRIGNTRVRGRERAAEQILGICRESFWRLRRARPQRREVASVTSRARGGWVQSRVSGGLGMWPGVDGAPSGRGRQAAAAGSCSIIP